MKLDTVVLVAILSAVVALLYSEIRDNGPESAHSDAPVPTLRRFRVEITHCQSGRLAPSSREVALHEEACRRWTEMYDGAVFSADQPTQSVFYVTRVLDRPTVRRADECVVVSSDTWDCSVPPMRIHSGLFSAEVSSVLFWGVAEDVGASQLAYLTAAELEGQIEPLEAVED